MTYSACDFTDDIADALGVELPDDAPDDSLDILADLALAEIARLKGLAIQLCPPDGTRERKAMAAVAYLRHARDILKSIGAVRTSARVGAIMSSARGAVRAASYRDARLKETSAKEKTNV